MTKSVDKEVIMKYLVYINTWHRRVRVHREGCSAIKMHGGGGVNGAGWWEEFDDLDTAKKGADVLAKWCKSNDHGPCAWCDP